MHTKLLLGQQILIIPAFGVKCTRVWGQGNHFLLLHSDLLSISLITSWVVAVVISTDKLAGMPLSGASVSSTTSVPSANPSILMDTVKHVSAADPTTVTMLLLGRLMR